MGSSADCYTAAIGPGTDPGGVPWAELDPRLLRSTRTSLKWTRFAPDVLPLFVAEMDFAVAPEIRRTLIERVEASDTGYLDSPGPLAGAFGDFAQDRWGWRIDPDFVHLATDVSVGIVEPLRLALGDKHHGRIAVTTPVYPSFFEMLEELPVEVVQVPLAETSAAGGEPAARLDLDALERVFSGSDGQGGLDALILSNPHNPHGLLHTREELAQLAQLAAAHGVFVVSDEIHAPLTHRGQVFTPFAPLAAAAGALSVTATSASKGWNLAGVKCSVIVAADEPSQALLRRLPPEVTTRASILGLHAGVSAFRDARAWLDRAVSQVEANDALLSALIAEHLPDVRHTRPVSGYLAWLDFREAGFGDDPYRRILSEAKVALGRGASFGIGGEGHVRLNLACAPDTIVEAVDRIARLR